MESLDRIRQTEELFKLIVWIRWPKEPRNHWLGMVRCISAYMRDQHGPVTINKTDEAILNLLSRYLRADLIELMFSMEAPFPPDFEIVTNGTKYSDDIDFAARLINIILQKNIDLKDGSIAVSLNLVSVLLEKKFFGKNWFMSRTKFHKLWTDRSPSLPFMFVERYHSGLDLTIDPKHPTFKDAVDELLQQPDQIRDYLARCKWVIARLGDQLDPRALRRIPFPRFPAELTPIEAPCSPLKAEELVRIATIIDPSKLLI
ncbi:hypothetical protein [uncultured Methylobacterium sp.]|uniref:hypothetical protein n=1 Tax=uncultured Methylobacterium sp. TaxID=157278 RepID=UPI0026320E6D|nr:hypothetical protein [uncultured Methylobacterium sp.]